MFVVLARCLTDLVSAILREKMIPCHHGVRARTIEKLEKRTAVALITAQQYTFRNLYMYVLLVPTRSNSVRFALRGAVFPDKCNNCKMNISPHLVWLAKLIFF